MTFIRRMPLIAATIFAVVALAPAAVDSVNPLSVADGTEVTVTGSGFGTAPAAFLVNGPTRVAMTRLKKPKPADASFHARVRKMPAGAYTLEVTPKGASSAFSFPGVTVERPRVGQVTPASAAAGAKVTVSGTFFGKTKGSVLVGCAVAKVKKWDGAAGTATFVVPVGVLVGPADVIVVNAAGDASAPSVGAVAVTATGGTGQAVNGTLGPDCFAADQKHDYGDDATTGARRVLTVTALHKAGGVQQYLFMQADVASDATFPMTVAGSVHYKVNKTSNLQTLQDYLSPAGGVPVTIDGVSGGFIDGSFTGTILIVAGAGTYGPSIDCRVRFHAKIAP